MPNKSSLISFLVQFPDEDAYMKYLESLRWKNGGVFSL